MMILPPPGSDYVALGSSFAAGPGLRPRATGSPRRSGRSEVNYAHLAAARLGLHLDDVTYSGATTGDIVGSSPSDPARQLDAVTSSTRLVTLTAGGNDIGYLPGLTLSSLPGTLGLLPSVRRRLESALDPSTLDSRFSRLESSLHLVVQGVRDRAPGATIVLVDYLTILPWPDEPGGVADDDLAPLTPDVIHWVRDVSARLTATTSAVAASSGAVFVPAAAASRQHHAWSAEPWTRRFHLGLRGGAPYHPTAAGMRGIADLICDLDTPPGDKEPS